MVQEAQATVLKVRCSDSAMIFYCMSQLLLNLDYIPQTQGDLPGTPSILQPSPDKVDLQRLKDDIPKYQTWLSSTAWEDWEALV